MLKHGWNALLCKCISAAFQLNQVNSVTKALIRH